MIENSKKTKILLACTHSFGAKFFEGQLKYLYENGFDVYVISASGKEIEELCRLEKATLIPFGFTRKIDLFRDLNAVLKVTKIIRKLKPEIINAGTPKAGLIVALAGRLAGIKHVVFTLRGLRSDTLTGLKKTLVKSMERLTCSAANYVIPISPSLAKHAIAVKILNKKKVVLLGKGSSNGVNTERFTKSLVTNSKKLEQEFSIGENDFVIGYVGRLNNDKGIAGLFDSFEKLSNEYSKVKLLLLGKFEDEDAIASEIKLRICEHKNVVIVPYTDAVEEIYAILDVLVLFSKREGFGNILIEASSMELPVIASDIPGCRDAVENNYTGYLVDNSNLVELSTRLRNYLLDESLRKKHGKNGRKWVLENFKSETIWNAQVALYNKLLNNQSLHG